MVPLQSPPPPFPHPPDWARAAASRLGAQHPILAGIETRAGPLPWPVRDRGFPGLLRAICAQLVSNEAAFAIWRRVSALPGATTPDGFLALDPVRVGTEGGLTRQKVAHARGLATAILDGTLRLDALDTMADEAAVAHLCQVKGIGRWTAEVHLLFSLDRPDVFPAGDLALQAAVAQLAGLPARPDARALAAMARDWAPHRSVAARLLWHHWLHHTKRATLDPA
ncbi:DNA-3-methyladenine glycosylase family protein [Falsiroseomonas oryziterrae]|uniref:DNA-3-methyladenine glycosylase family protein n=1 Tax=Falsiroseomonas oryziterrae TaxID=2911368 RepID=UPI001F1A9B80|nr:DNA-3-methyladenine glycosylase 2 family protein [Roseomonas sp. NPKOSM-4]